MKKLNWKSLFKKAFSPGDSDARAQEKAAAYALGGILVLLFLPLMIVQITVEGAKLVIMAPALLGSLVLKEKLGVSERVLGICMFIMTILGIAGLLAVVGVLGRLYRGL